MPSLYQRLSTSLRRRAEPARSDGLASMHLAPPSRQATRVAPRGGRFRGRVSSGPFHRAWFTDSAVGRVAVVFAPIEGAPARTPGDIACVVAVPKGWRPDAHGGICRDWRCDRRFWVFDVPPAHLATLESIRSGEAYRLFPRLTSVMYYVDGGVTTTGAIPSRIPCGW